MFTSSRKARRKYKEQIVTLKEEICTLQKELRENKVKKLKSARFCSYCRSRNSDWKRCGRCLNAYYCSVDCQRAHWKKHKHDCQKKEWFRLWDVTLSQWHYDKIVKKYIFLTMQFAKIWLLLFKIFWWLELFFSSCAKNGCTKKWNEKKIAFYLVAFSKSLRTHPTWAAQDWWIMFPKQWMWKELQTSSYMLLVKAPQSHMLLKQ